MQDNQTQKVLFSGIQPTGIITIGNYIGALKNWVALQDSHDCIFCIVDMHAITVPQEPQNLRRQTFELLALDRACGLDPKKSTLFLQSHVPAHAELAWVLNCNSSIGELSRMTQFKDKSKKHADNINMGLMDYPVLMAADILLYQTALVPVGADQKQHLELARDIAVRFNNKYSETFTVPEPYIAKHGSKIMSLADPLSKMSKSDENENGYISMTDAPEVILRKFKRAVTDSDNCVKFSKEKPGVSNLMTVYSAFTGESLEKTEKIFENKGYGDFKQAVAEAVIEKLKPIQQEQKRYLGDKDYLNSVLKEGAEKASRAAFKMLRKVYKKVGFYQL